MCDPVSLTVAATAVAALGQGYSALSQNAQSRYEAKVYQQDAKLEEGRASDALQRGTADAITYQKKLSQTEGDQNAALAANGIDITFGSAAAVRRDLHDSGMQDTVNIYKNAAREAQGYEINSMNYKAQASAAKSQAHAAIISGLFNMGSTILGGATQISKFQAAQNFGVGSGGGGNGALAIGALG